MPRRRRRPVPAFSPFSSLCAFSRRLAEQVPHAQPPLQDSTQRDVEWTVAEHCAGHRNRVASRDDHYRSGKVVPIFRWIAKYRCSHVDKIQETLGFREQNDPSDR